MSDTPRTDAHFKQIQDDAIGLEYVANELQYWAEKLERELAEVNKALRIAVGLLSTYPKLSSEHPEYTLEYILNIAAMKEGK
jgi:hypothetical protein